jgi:predicted nucleotide-binding protein
VKLLSDKINPEEGKKLQKITRNFATYDPIQDILYDVNKYRAFLLSLEEELEKHPDGIIAAQTEKSPTVLVEAKPKLFTSRTVFIVHGHDEATKQSVARFLERLDLEVVILHERPDRGKTVIEKLEASSSEVDIAYAIVILTPDDVGAQISEKDKLRPRARQNVVFELGYFIAKLGRQRVRALYTEGVELPSDYQGVLYTPLDKPGAWKLELAREIKAAGIAIDLNKIA